MDVIFRQAKLQPSQVELYNKKQMPVQHFANFQRKLLHFHLLTALKHQFFLLLFAGYYLVLFIFFIDS